MIVSGILFFGSVFVFIMYLLLFRITRRIVDNDRLKSRLMAAEETNRVKSSFLAGFSHEMRTPLKDGLEATKEIRALARADAKTIPIFAMTANVFDEDVERSLAAGMNAHLSKPIEPDRLYETLARQIAGENGGKLA